jgi:hypothetical protein
VGKACPWFSVCGVSSCCCKAQKEQGQWGEELPIVVLLAGIGTCNKGRKKKKKREEKEKEEEKKKKKEARGQECGAPLYHRHLCSSFSNYQVWQASKACIVLGRHKIRWFWGIQFRPPFFFQFFSNFSNLGCKFGIHLNLPTFLFFVINPCGELFIHKLDEHVFIHKLDEHVFIHLADEHGLVITLVGWSLNNILKTMHWTH